MVHLTDDNISILVVFLELFLEMALLVSYVLGATSSAVMQPGFFLTVIIIIFLVDLVFTLVFGLRGTISYNRSNIQEPVERRWINIYFLHFLRVLFFNTILLILLIIWSGKFYTSVHNPELPEIYTDFPGELEPYIIYRNLFYLGIVIVYLDFSSAFNIVSIIKYEKVKSTSDQVIKRRISLSKSKFPATNGLFN